MSEHGSGRDARKGAHHGGLRRGKGQASLTRAVAGMLVAGVLVMGGAAGVLVMGGAAGVLVVASTGGCGGPGKQAPSECGNGALEPGEQCDDGNEADGDGCDATCALERCGDGECGPAESPANCAEDCPMGCGDGMCAPPDETPDTCPTDCGPCTVIADLSDLVGGAELFYGYASLGRHLATPGCGALDPARELYLTLTPAFSGNLVLSTVHRSTSADTVVELRDARCDGAALACDANASGSTHGSRVSWPVEAGHTYVALVETADDQQGVFALGLHPEGVCEEQGVVQDITGALLTGQRFAVDTAASTASQRGGCAADHDNPEARLAFTPPRAGTLVATTRHADTTFAAALYVREGVLGGATLCDSPEAERACATDGGAWGADPVLRFEVLDQTPYSLLVDGAGAGSQGQATVTLGYQAHSPHRTSLLGCDHTAIEDRFYFFADAGQAVYLLVDTVDAATAADTRLRVLRPDGTELHEADDEVDCTYPPPSYRCPQHEFTAAAAGLYGVDVYVGSSESCADPTVVNYELTVTTDGADAELIHVKDQ